MPTTKPDRTQRFEGLVLVLIMLTVAGFAGAASFTHVKDWTLANSPAGTGEWFGWVNAVISELVPIAALLTIRRRHRTGGPIGYPLFLLVAAAGLSLSAQLAVAKPGLSGWLLSAVPSLAFMALVKLVLAPVHTNTRPTVDTTPAAVVADTPAPADTVPAAVERPEPAPAPVEQPTLGKVEPVTVPAHLIPPARFVVVNHEQHTGAPITVDELADRLGITSPIAAALINAINPPAERVNGNTPVLDGAR